MVRRSNKMLLCPYHFPFPWLLQNIRISTFTFFIMAYPGSIGPY